MDAGYLGIAGFGVWRGQSLWSRHIELKHQRELERLSMDRMEKSFRLEMELTRNLAEIKRMEDFPELTTGAATGELAFDPGVLPFVCNCRSDSSWHMHVYKGGREQYLTLSLGAIVAIRDGQFADLCICGDSAPGIHHHHDGRAYETLSGAGYTIRSSGG